MYLNCNTLPILMCSKITIGLGNTAIQYKVIAIKTESNLHFLHEQVGKAAQNKVCRKLFQNQ